MSKKGTRATLALCSLVLAACGAKTLDFTDPDAAGGSSGSGTAGKGGSGGEAGGGGGTGGIMTGGTAGTSGGTAGTSGGTAGTGGAPPGPYVTSSFRGTKPSKIDLLFMIDNSSSMSDKQTILSTAVPDLVDQLIQPRCIDPITGRTVGNAINGTCAVGELAFEPIKDIHVGIITSSLGNHGAGGDICNDVSDINQGRADPHNNDRAHLVARGNGGAPVSTFESKGFLYYNPSAAGALASSTAVGVPFTEMVKGVGQHGCGYEASLEAVYRFLVDPEPYDSIRIDTSIGGFGQAVLTGTDQELLKQRADFLRPDSLVSVVLVTDENDCSIIDGNQGFYAILPSVPGTGRNVLKPGTAICKTNPNDRCCVNCNQQAPAGCASTVSDPACQFGELTIADDPTNLRCFNQKQRYGADFLYPVQRYIDGFTKTKVPNRMGAMVNNPLFLSPTCGSACTARDPSYVFMTGIVGVPWQALARDPDDLSKGYRTPAQMRDSGTWANVIGDPQNAAGPVPPGDPHMIESIKPRDGLPGPGSGPFADRVHGHEWDPSRDSFTPNADLQFACTFELATPKVCTSTEDCDCGGQDLTAVQNPLCQNTTGAYTNTQLRAKAYPGTRILQVLQGLGDQGAAASICPAQVSEPQRDDYGYAPAIGAILDRLRHPLRGTCMPQVLPIDPMSGQTSCSVIEVHNDPSCQCNQEPGRIKASDSLITPEMRSAGSCFCEILQLNSSGQIDALNACKATLNDPPASAGNGWCYVDPAQDSRASCDVVAGCPLDNKRTIHFINTNSEPRPGSTPFLICQVPPLTTAPSAVCK
jgi:hypothetical protein